MTMAGLRSALEAKNPQKEKPRISTEEEYEELMEIADALMIAEATQQPLMA